jgi:TDG/mug DNA glycosylase family protein
VTRRAEVEAGLTAFENVLEASQRLCGSTALSRLNRLNKERLLLDDLLAPDLKILFCGSAVGKVSAVRRAYYAGPGNKFWPTLYRIGLTPRQLAPGEYRDLLQFGLGLTDVEKRQSGSDSDIDFRRSDPAGLTRKVLDYRPRYLAFNGKKAAQVYLRRHDVEYGLQSELVGRARLFVAPSTSGAANGFWNEELWLDLAELVEEAAI